MVHGSQLIKPDLGLGGGGGVGGIIPKQAVAKPAFWYWGGGRGKIPKCTGIYMSHMPPPPPPPPPPALDSGLKTPADPNTTIHQWKA